MGALLLKRHLPRGLSENLRGHLVQQFLLILKVPVNRGSLHTQPGSQPAQGQPFQARFVENGEGLVEDDFRSRGIEKIVAFLA